MTERFGELELLAWVEDELDAPRREALAARLAEEPDTLARVEAMRRDRAALRSAPMPVPPVDLLAALEPALARPMLLEPAPGEYRRRHRHAARRRRAVRVVAAAVVLVAAGAGLWMAAAALLAQRQTAAPDLVARAKPPGAGGAVIEAGTEDRRPARSSTRPPDPGPPRGEEKALGGEAASPAPAEAGGSSRIQSAFALALPARDEGEAWDLLLRVLEKVTAGGEGGTLAEPVSLVRNFRFDQAAALLRRMRRGGADPGAAPEVVAGLEGRGAARDPGTRRKMAEVLRRLRDRGSGEEGRPESPRRLGPAALAPSYERQLELSGRGAAYTVTLPVSKLAALLAGIGIEEGRPSRLLALPEARAGGPAAKAASTGGRPPLRQWVEDQRAVQAFMPVLRGAPPGALVVLPIIIEPVGDDPG